MKNILFFLVLLLFTTFSSAQIVPNTPWIWMKGDNTIDQPGVYGTQGIPATANKPGARNFSTTWRDAASNLWLFGGSGYGTCSTGFLNDLWKFDPLNNRWIWMKGDSTIEQFSIYGTQGTANATNKPGATFAGVSWTDANHNLWLFGGFGYSNNAFGFLSSLWKYNTNTNEWTWVKGDSTINAVGNYGTQGIENTTNKPGARYGSQTWTDASGNLWLLGGYGYDSSTSGILNDIWKYNPATNNWTWIKGDIAVEQVGIYGTKGIANATNKPGARYVSTSWTDQSGNLWLFGGYGYDENNSGDLDDLWKYNPLTNEWTWVSGDKVIDQPGVYGTRGVPNTANKPGARYVSNSWIDDFGQLWMFGGYGYDSSISGYLNDLWKYSPSSNKWTWIKGDNTVDHVGVYGTQGMPDTSNKSGARTGSVSWADGIGNLWLFGGYGFDGNSSGVLNDLWKISSFGAILPIHLLDFSGTLNNEAVLLQWKTEKEENFSHFNIQRSFDGISFITIGNVIGAGNSNRNDYTFSDNDLRNRQLLKIFYRLQLMDKNGHFTYSKILRFDLKQKATSISIFPNPAVNSLNLFFFQGKQEMVMISITDMKGVTVKKQTENISSGSISINIDVSTLPPAGYILSVINEKGLALYQKFIKQ
jgi:hypothetical protein